MKDSGIDWIGKIPKHWMLKELKKIIRSGTSITYGIVQTGDDIENGIRCIRTGYMKGKSFPKNGYVKISSSVTGKIDLRELVPN